ncbi:potassium channel subfamily K member 2-like isoform X2 [Mizuhopecten yessoensis]|uniref:potassium channel subfamily K member 2-like isoform X2 n=1 Tax=Mizuhopecten yessoensis TaxID=6573 RepID=UPI000B45DC7B|nr:potassium channel subfamily K member 2-like isoform X2 [Mizuhopecten yessoensis]
MKKLTLFLLGLGIAVYVLIGGAVMMALESSNESDTKTTSRSTFTNFLAQTCVSSAELETFVKAVITAYDQGIIATEQTDSASLWDYVNSVFFSMTAVTTIGYGNQTPATSGGRAFIVVFALIGIPLVAVFLSGIGDKIAGLTKSFQEKQFSKNHEVAEHRLKAVIIPITGLVILLFVPAAIFSAVEDWNYGEALYYCLITLTTIGFGDFVIGTQDATYRLAYRLLTLIWIMLGLAYVAALISQAQAMYTQVTDKIDTKVQKDDDKKTNHEGSKTKIVAANGEEGKRTGITEL